MSAKRKINDFLSKVKASEENFSHSFFDFKSVNQKFERNYSEFPKGTDLKLNNSDPYISALNKTANKLSETNEILEQKYKSANGGDNSVYESYDKIVSDYKELSRPVDAPKSHLGLLISFLVLMVLFGAAYVVFGVLKLVELPEIISYLPYVFIGLAGASFVVVALTLIFSLIRVSNVNNLIEENQTELNEIEEEAKVLLSKINEYKKLQNSVLIEMLAVEEECIQNILSDKEYGQSFIELLPYLKEIIELLVNKQANSVVEATEFVKQRIRHEELKRLEMENNRLLKEIKEELSEIKNLTLANSYMNSLELKD